jgi:hypothetical protein
MDPSQDYSEVASLRAHELQELEHAHSPILTSMQLPVEVVREEARPLRDTGRSVSVVGPSSPQTAEVTFAASHGAPRHDQMPMESDFYRHREVAELYRERGQEGIPDEAAIHIHDEPQSFGKYSAHQDGSSGDEAIVVKPVVPKARFSLLAQQVKNNLQASGRGRKTAFFS